MASMTAADVRLGLKVWIGVGGPVFSMALVLMGWDYLHLKFQDVPKRAAQSAVVAAAVVLPAAPLSPPWERISVPPYPVGATVRWVSAFSYAAPYKSVLNASDENMSNASYEDTLLMRPKPASAKRGRHAQP
jgi:hypothetical protein